MANARHPSLLADFLLARHAILGSRDCVTSQKNVCEKANDTHDFEWSSGGGCIYSQSELSDFFKVYYY